jgi:hypothetical protein
VVWPIFGLTFVVITMGFFVPSVDAVVVLSVLGAGLAGYGLVRHRLRPLSGFPLQAAGFIGFLAAAVAAAQLPERAATVVLAGALLAHAGWDLYHFRRRRVVVPAYAEFCLTLDLVLAVWLVATVIR